MISQRWQDYRNELIGGGGNARSGYVRKLEAMNNITLHKVSNPSKYLINKYSKKDVIPEIDIEPEVVQSLHDHLQHQHHVQEHVEDHGYDQGYDDYQVADLQQYRKDKKKARTLTKADKLEIQKEKEQEQERIRQETAQVARNKSLESYEKLKVDVVSMRDEMGKLETIYLKSINDLKSVRTRKDKKDVMQQNLILEHHKNQNDIKQKYVELFNYIKNNKIGDISKVFSHINSNIKKL